MADKFALLLSSHAPSSLSFQLVKKKGGGLARISQVWMFECRVISKTSINALNAIGGMELLIVRGDFLRSSSADFLEYFE